MLFRSDPGPRWGIGGEYGRSTGSAGRKRRHRQRAGVAGPRSLGQHPFVDLRFQRRNRWRDWNIDMPAGAEPSKDLLASESTEEEHAEGIGIESIGDEETDRSGVLARVGPVWTGAAWLQFARPCSRR